MTIHIESLQFDTIIGLLDFERTTPQRIIIEVELSYQYTPSSFINYADLSNLIEEHIKLKQYELLEEALLGLKTMIDRSYNSVETLKLKIIKPDILDNCSVGLSQKWDLKVYVPNS